MPIRPPKPTGTEATTSGRRRIRRSTAPSAGSAGTPADVPRCAPFTGGNLYCRHVPSQLVPDFSVEFELARQLHCRQPECPLPGASTS